MKQKMVENQRNQKRKFLYFNLSVGKSKKTLVSLDTLNNRILLECGESKVIVGKAKSPEQFEGAFLTNLNIGTIGLFKGKGVGIAAADNNQIAITGKENLKITIGGDINITADGNINLKSTKGNVTINSKKVRINE